MRSNHFAGHGLVTVIAVTATLADAPPLRIPLAPTPENGLRVPSQAMIDHIQSVHVQRIGGVIGRLAPTDLSAIDRAVAVYLGFAD